MQMKQTFLKFFWTISLNPMRDPILVKKFPYQLSFYSDKTCKPRKFRNLISGYNIPYSRIY